MLINAALELGIPILASVLCGLVYVKLGYPVEGVIASAVIAGLFSRRMKGVLPKLLRKIK